MRALLTGVMLAAAAACGGRQVEVRTGPAPTADVAVHLTNNLSQAVTVYVNSGGNDMFVGQVPANTTEHLPVRGIAAGTSVTLKAVRADGTYTYSRENVVLNGTYMWVVP